MDWCFSHDILIVLSILRMILSRCAITFVKLRGLDETKICVIKQNLFMGKITAKWRTFLGSKNRREAANIFGDAKSFTLGGESNKRALTTIST